jgi:hypothetical protein
MMSKVDKRRKIDADERKRIESQCPAIHACILEAAHRFDADGHAEAVTEWSIDHDLLTFVKTAVDFYMLHVERLGVDKYGWPRKTSRAVKALRIALQERGR